jgi:hypothetical protein
MWADVRAVLSQALAVTGPASSSITLQSGTLALDCARVAVPVMHSDGTIFVSTPNVSWTGYSGSRGSLRLRSRVTVSLQQVAFSGNGASIVGEGEGAVVRVSAPSPLQAAVLTLDVDCYSRPTSLSNVVVYADSVVVTGGPATLADTVRVGVTVSQTHSVTDSQCHYHWGIVATVCAACARPRP